MWCINIQKAQHKINWWHVFVLCLVETFAEKIAPQPNNMIISLKIVNFSNSFYK